MSGILTILGKPSPVQHPKRLKTNLEKKRAANLFVAHANHNKKKKNTRATSYPIGYLFVASTYGDIAKTVAGCAVVIIAPKKISPHERVSRAYELLRFAPQKNVETSSLLV